MVNLSVKKARPVRNTSRKVPAKPVKAVPNRRKKQDVVSRVSSPNNPKDWFVSLPVKGGKTGEKNDEKKKKKKGKNSKRKKKEPTFCLLSSSDSDNDDEKPEEKEKVTAARQKANFFGSFSTSISKFSSFIGEEKKNCDAEEVEDTENKENLGCSANASRMSTVSNRTRSKLAMRNSPGLSYSENFRKYSALKQRDSDDEPNAGSHSGRGRYRRILTRKQYESQNRSKMTRKSEADVSIDCKNVSTRRWRSDNSQIYKITKPCSVVIMKCNENEDPVASRKESAASYNEAQSSEDIFQSSVSNIDQNPVKIASPESEKTGEAPSSKNNSNFLPNVVDRRHKRDPNQKLKLHTCSTPICPFVNMYDRSINCLSPIDGKEGDENSRSDINYIDVANGNEVPDVPKVSTRRRSARKRLSISYEEDESFQPSNENVAYGENLELMKSPTSGIQESLKILKLNFGNSSNKQDADKRRLSQKNNVATSADSSVISNRCTTNEFTGKCIDTCSQLTPVGIISTRSGRQLKLSMTTQEKFFNDTEEPNALLATPKIGNKSRDIGYEIIENSEIEKHELQKHRINNIRGSRFTVFKSFATKNPINDVKSTSIPLEDDANETQSSDEPTTPGDLKTISSETRSRFSTPENRKESESNGSCSIIDDERCHTSASDPDDQQINHVTASDQEVLQSIIESTKNLDSLNIRSHDEDSGSVFDPGNNDDSDADWSTISSKRNTDDTSDAQLDTTNNSKIESSSCIESDENDIGLESSTTPSRESSNSTTSDAQEEGNQREESIPFDSSKESIEEEETATTTKTAREPSLNISERLLSTGITTRKHRKTASRRVTENVMEVSEEKDDAMKTSDRSKSAGPSEMGSVDRSDSNEDSETKEEKRYSYNESTDSDSTEEPSDPKPMINLQPIVLLERLKCLPRISNSEMKDLTQSFSELSSPEDSEEKKSSKRSEISESLDSPLERSEKMNSFLLKADRTPGDAKFDFPEPEVVGRQSVFLKPGKDWARSLSVLNHIQDRTDLESLSSGKGKNWRQSVQTILGMQRESKYSEWLCGKNKMLFVFLNETKFDRLKC